MAKRFTDTDKWKDDWFISLSNDYRIIWQWLLDNCNHAGICKPSLSIINRDCNTKITESDFFNVFNERVIKCNDMWFLPKFIKFQYSTLQSKKPAIVSVVKELKKGNYFKMIPESFGNDYIIVKDKDTDTVKDIINNKEGENLKKEIDTSKKVFYNQLECVVDVSIDSCMKMYFYSTNFEAAIPLLMTHHNCKAKTENELKRMAIEFNDHCILEGKLTRSLNEWAKHFRYWVIDAKRLLAVSAQEESKIEKKTIVHKTAQQISDERRTKYG